MQLTHRNSQKADLKIKIKALLKIKEHKEVIQRHLKDTQPRIWEALKKKVLILVKEPKCHLLFKKPHKELMPNLRPQDQAHQASRVNQPIRIKVGKPLREENQATRTLALAKPGDPIPPKVTLQEVQPSRSLQLAGNSKLAIASARKLLT